MRQPKGTSRIGRLIGFLMLLSGSVFLILLAVAMAQENVLAEGWYLLAFLVAMFVVIACLSLTEFPDVELTEAGVSVRILFLKRHYAWREIKQAGILYRWGRNCRFNELVLVTPKGSLRKYKDRLFLLRNPFTLIKMPWYSEELRQYVCRHYGPLDFDLSDGRPEQSVVVE